MLTYDPAHETGHCTVRPCGTRRQLERAQLLDDVPALHRGTGDAVGVGDFYETIYNATPAHKDDNHRAIIDNPDIAVITPAGGERRAPARSASVTC